MAFMKAMIQQDRYAQLLSVTQLGLGFWRVSLCVSDFDFLPGQYLQLATQCGIERYFSIATKQTTLSNGISKFDLLVSSSGEGNGTAALISELCANQQIRVNGPFGFATLRPLNDDEHSIFVAYDTGYAYVAGLIDSLLHERPAAHATLICFSRSEDGNIFYKHSSDRTASNKNFTSLEVKGRDHWPRSHGDFVLELLTKHSPSKNLNGIYVGGSLKRTLALAQELTSANIPAAQIISDHLNQGEQKYVG